jgi:hypothetical protein
MKKYLVILMAIYLLVLSGCLPNLKPRKPVIDFTQDFIRIKVCNGWFGHADPQLTYVEINEVGAAETAKPQSQYIAHVPDIAGWHSWSSENIPFDRFSTRPGIDLASLTTANVVVRVDAKEMVKETKEDDNLYDANH